MYPRDRVDLRTDAIPIMTQSLTLALTLALTLNLTLILTLAPTVPLLYPYP